jgi:hypothetical protein
MWQKSIKKRTSPKEKRLDRKTYALYYKTLTLGFQIVQKKLKIPPKTATVLH